MNIAQISGRVRINLMRMIRGNFTGAKYVSLNITRGISRMYTIAINRKYPSSEIPIKTLSEGRLNEVSLYWGEHTVNSMPFSTQWESQLYYRWLVKKYPLLEHLMDFNQKRKGQNILDYGCWPGNDLFRFLVINNAGKFIGIDVSQKALELARLRLSLYNVKKERLELILQPEGADTLPLEDESINHINFAGVLHHTTNPEVILKEFHRVLKHGGSGNIMVYNHDSIFFHLYVAYLCMIIAGQFPGQSVEEAFSKSTDGENCPVARCYRGPEFSVFCRNQGFDVAYLGGYYDELELYWARYDPKKAINDTRLGDEHREFLKALIINKNGYPLYEGKYTGFGGAYKIIKR
jgi:ubiquinone/menaquinone biosynthesis C-methylase UbiE